MMRVIPAHSFNYNGNVHNVYYANAGEGLPAHTHHFNHITVCCAGSCIVRKDGRELTMTKETQPVNLIADEWHEIEALEDNTVFINILTEAY